MKHLSVESIYKEFNENINNVKSYFFRVGNIALDEDAAILAEQLDHVVKAIQASGIDIKKLSQEKKKEKEKNTEDKGGNDEIKLELSKEQLKVIYRIVGKSRLHTPKNHDLLSNSAFILLNNYFEYLLSDLLSYYYYKYKDSLNKKVFKLSLQEINEHESVESLIKSMIQKEVEFMLIDLNFNQLLNHFEENLDIPLEKQVVNYDSLVEARERRHLIVHNSSIVNKKYIKRSSNLFNLNQGDKISIDKDYFEKTIMEFELAGLVLLLNCWGRWDTESADLAISEILNRSFDFLREEKFSLANRLGLYSKQIDPRNDSQEDWLLRIKFNRCTAMKRLDKKQDLKAELKSIKTGTMMPIFKIAHDILSDKKDKIIERMQDVIQSEDIDVNDYNEWPLFYFVRNDESLNEKVLQLFEENNQLND